VRRLAVLEFGVAAAPGLFVALAAVAAVGVANLIVNTMSRTLMLTGVADGLQGRVMAIYSLVFLSSSPVGGPVVGWLCGILGARAGMVAGGGGALIASGVLIAPGRRAWRPGVATASSLNALPRLGSSAMSSADTSAADNPLPRKDAAG
jgi:hypothetical protein